MGSFAAAKELRPRLAVHVGGPLDPEQGQDRGREVDHVAAPHDARPDSGPGADHECVRPVVAEIVGRDRAARRTAHGPDPVRCERGEQRGLRVPGDDQVGQIGAPLPREQPIDCGHRGRLDPGCRIHELLDRRAYPRQEFAVFPLPGDRAERLAALEIDADIPLVGVRDEERLGPLPVDAGVHPLHAQPVVQAARHAQRDRLAPRERDRRARAREKPALPRLALTGPSPPVEAQAAEHTREEMGRGAVRAHPVARHDDHGDRLIQPLDQSAARAVDRLVYIQ